MQMRAKAKGLRSAVRRFGTGSVAARLGVNPSTIRRWLKTPRLIRDDTLERLASPITGFGDEEGVSPKVLRAVLKFDSKALALIFGVTQATAARWKRDKKIPPRHHHILVDVAPEPVPRQLRTVMRRFGLKALFTEGFEFTTQVNAIVSEKLIRLLINWGHKIHVPRPWPKGPGPKFQFVFQGEILLEAGESFMGVGSSKDTQTPVKQEDGKVKFFKAIPTGSYELRSDAMNDFVADLRGVQDQSFRIESATLWVRWDKLVKGKDRLPKPRKPKSKKSKPKKSNVKGKKR